MASAPQTGTPDTIPLSAPELGHEERDLVDEVLRSGWVSTAGPYVDRFEAEVAELLGRRHAIATTSGTAALHTALLVAGVRSGDEVVLPALSFIAPANAVRYAGAWPAFVDVDPFTWQLDPAALKRFLEEDCEREPDGTVRNTHTGRPVTGVMPVDILGHPADVEAVMAVAEEFGLFLVEDAAEALGARYLGRRDTPHATWRRVGALGEVVALSFNGNKIVTCGGGGMLVTDSDETASRARYLTTQAKDDPLEYVHCSVGFNYRLTSVQAAIGSAQLRKLDEFVERKRAIATRYAAGLADLPGLTTPPEAGWARSTFWLFTVLVDPDSAGLKPREVLHALIAQGIQARPLWQPLHHSPAHTGAYSAPCDTAESLHFQAISLPCSVGLSEPDQERVITALQETCR